LCDCIVVVCVCRLCGPLIRLLKTIYIDMYICLVLCGQWPGASPGLVCVAEGLCVEAPAAVWARQTDGVWAVAGQDELCCEDCV